MQSTTTRPAALLVIALLVAGILAALSTGAGARALPIPRTPSPARGVEGDPIASTRVLMAALPLAQRAADESKVVEVMAAPVRKVPVAASRGAARSASSAPLVWPARGPLTGWWQEQRGDRSHGGIDIDGNTGDAVWSAAAGRVVHAGPATSGYSGYGLLVVVDHGNGQTVYAHLSRIDVAAGDVVSQFTTLGAMGTTGNVTGSHLHFELRVSGVAVDPTPYLPPR